MKLSGIGEFGLIRKFRKMIKTDSSVIKGSGDDCAVLKFDKENFQLFTCDMIIEGVDFKISQGFRLIGRKALTVSVSDIAACGGIPAHAVVSMGLPKNIKAEQVEILAKGIIDTAKEFKINIVGGDISVSEKLIIDVSMLGLVKKNMLCLRSGAKNGDLIMVTGDFGGSIKGKHLRFTPRIKESRYLVERFKINSMIDVSDGLVQDLGHILEESAKGAVIYESLIPLSRQAKSVQEALSSGEEFELIFTLSRDQASKLLKTGKYKFKLIGEVMPESFGLRIIDYNNKYAANSLFTGYRHF